MLDRSRQWGLMAEAVPCKAYNFPKSLAGIARIIGDAGNVTVASADAEAYGPIQDPNCVTLDHNLRH